MFGAVISLDSSLHVVFFLAHSSPFITTVVNFSSSSFSVSLKHSNLVLSPLNWVRQSHLSLAAESHTNWHSLEMDTGGSSLKEVSLWNCSLWSWACRHTSLTPARGAEASGSLLVWWVPEQPGLLEKPHLDKQTNKQMRIVVFECLIDLRLGKNCYT